MINVEHSEIKAPVLISQSVVLHAQTPFRITDVTSNKVINRKENSYVYVENVHHKW